MYVAAVIAALILLVFFLINVFAPSHQFSSSAAKAYTWWPRAQTFFTNAAGMPIMAVAGDDGAREGKPTILFTDLLTNEEIKSVPLTAGSKDINGYSLRTFKNNEVYLIVDFRKIFKVNKADYSVQDVTATLLAPYPELASGIAKAKFSFGLSGESLDILTNDGSTYTLFLFENKVYKEDEVYAVGREKAKEPGKQKQAFVFSESNTTGLPKLLMRLEIKDNGNVPSRIPTINWDKAELLPGENPFVDNYLKPTNWTSFTPDAKYFNPEMLYFDSSMVVFKVTATPSDESQWLLQCLDAKTAKLRWPLPVTARYINYALPYKNGLMVMSSDSAFVVSDEGKILSSYSR